MRSLHGQSGYCLMINCCVPKSGWYNLACYYVELEFKREEIDPFFTCLSQKYHILHDFQLLRSLVADSFASG